MFHAVLVRLDVHVLLDLEVNDVGRWANQRYQHTPFSSNSGYLEGFGALVPVSLKSSCMTEGGWEANAEC